MEFLQNIEGERAGHAKGEVVDEHSISKGVCMFVFLHQENLSVKCVPTQTPLLYSKTGVCRGITVCLIFAPKHILWARRF